MMKNILLISLFTVIIFIVLTFSTASLMRQVDGNDMYGFPVAFYILYSGMVYPTPTTEMTNFIFFNLILDIAVAFVIAIIIIAVFQKIKKKFV